MSKDVHHSSIIVKEGLAFVILTGAAAVVAFAAGFPWVAAVLLVLTLFVTWFFRNPERSAPENPLQLVSPADGKVIRIEETAIDGRSDPSYMKISIFMNVFNVHVNRIPCSGRVAAIRYTPGKFLSANLDKASVHNERNAVLIRTDAGLEVTVIQVAGLIARRIVCWTQEGKKVEKGERFGLIRFGSRVEVLLPLGAAVPLVKTGDKVRAGETPIGELK